MYKLFRSGLLFLSSVFFTTATFAITTQYEQEPNNSTTTATSVALDSYFTGSSSSNSDDDYFKITLPQAGIYTLTHDPISTNNNNYYSTTATVTANSNTLISFSNYVTDSKSQSFQVSSAGDIYIRVNASTYSGSYRYIVTSSSGQSNTTLEQEPNNSTTSATSVALGSYFTGSSSGNSDDDYFKITLPQAGIYTLTQDPITTSNNNYYSATATVTANGSTLVSFSTYVTDTKSQSFQVSSATDIYIRVNAANVSNSYRYIVTSDSVVSATTTTSTTTTTTTTSKATTTTITTKANTTTTTSSTTSTTLNARTVSLTKGWNLIGSGGNQPLKASTLFGDKGIFVTVWKWLADRGQWAFYAPSMTATALSDYAGSKGYQVLDTIQGSEGFWVNALTDTSVSLPFGSTYTAIDHRASLSNGWNLISTGEILAPVRFNNYLTIYAGSMPPEIGSDTTTTVYQENLTSLWAWDATKSSWYFYAPSLDRSQVLGDYITGKGYLDFTKQDKKLGSGVGFWVNMPTK